MCSDMVMRFLLNIFRRSSRMKVGESYKSSCVALLPGSSTDVSEDWEKDFDLDMTEEEVQLALSKIEASGEVGVCYMNTCLFLILATLHTFFLVSQQLDEDWENWD